MGDQETSQERPRRKLSRRQQEIEARKASDPLAQLMERNDIDYGSDELPVAPRIQRTDK
jgi:hypothetical protein